MRGETASLLVTSGRGPAECELVVAQWSTRLLEQARGAGLTATVTDVTRGEHPEGARSATLRVSGAGAVEWAAAAVGPVCWQSVSPLRPAHRRKNWFIEVSTATDDTEQEITVNPEDVRFEPVRASGPGGQHRNKVSTGVRATHRPTGTVVLAVRERSQRANQQAALSQLTARLRQAADQAARDGRHQTWRRHEGVTRGTPAGQAERRVVEPLKVPPFAFGPTVDRPAAAGARRIF